MQMSKPVRPQDVKKGMWLVTTGEKTKPELQDNMFGDLLTIQRQAQSEQFIPTGIPMKVHAVSLPFVVGYISVQPDHLTTLDLTRFEVRIPTRSYVNVFINHYKANQAQATMPQGPLAQIIQTLQNQPRQ